MLVLSRKVDQDVVLELPDGRLMIVRVTKLGPESVRLGFIAPEDVLIARGELARVAGVEYDALITAGAL